MSKLAMCSVTFRDKSVNEIIELARLAQLDGIEWGGDNHVPPSNLKDAEHIGELTREAGLEVVAYGSYYFAGEEMDFTVISDTAKALGTRDIRIWAGKMDRDKEIGEIDQTDFERIVLDIKKVSEVAKEAGQIIHLEFHQWTYTDTLESALKLLERVDCSNVFTYWQPNVHSNHRERLRQVRILNQYISNIHVFHWDEEFERYPLSDGLVSWKEYVDLVKVKSDRYFSLEFVKDDSVEQFIEDANKLRELVRYLNLRHND